MAVSSQESSGLAYWVVGSARVIAFGTSIVAPAVSAVTVLLVMVAYAGFASPLVVLITFVASLCCAISILAARERAVIAALVISILVKIGPAHYTAAVFSPTSSPNDLLTDITDATIYGITAFAGFEAAAALGEEARNTRRPVPASIVGIVVVSGVFYLLVVCAEMFAVGRHGTGGFTAQASPLGYLTKRYWSPSVLWTIDLVVFVAGLSFVIAVVNAAIRIMYAMGRERVLPSPLARLSRRQTPVVAIGGLAVLTLALGLPLTYA